MRYMFIVTSAHAGPPPPALLEAMHKLADREIKAGRMLDNGGLMPLATGAQVRIKGGQLSVVDGPFVEAKEVIGGLARFLAEGEGKGLGAAGGVIGHPHKLIPARGGAAGDAAVAARGGPQ